MTVNFYDRVVPDLDDTIRALYEARDRHRQRIAQIEQAIALLGEPGADEQLFDLAVPRPTSVRDAVLAVFAERPEEHFDVGSLLTETFARGWRSTSANPRNTLASTLAKLADAGEIMRCGRGQYRAVDVSSQLAIA